MLAGHKARYNQYRGHVRTVEPAAEPITKAEVKAQLDLDAGDTSQDDMLDMFIQAARETAEEMTGLALIDQTWELTLDDWPASSRQWWDGVRDGAINSLNNTGRCADVIIPRYPAQSITSITADSISVTVADVFYVDVKQHPARLTLKLGGTLPTITTNAGGIVITYVSGYGASGSTVPASIRLALIQMVAYMYTNRGDCNCSAGGAYKASGAAQQLKSFMATQL